MTQATYMIVDGKPFGEVSAFEVRQNGHSAYVFSLASARKICDAINKDGLTFTKAVWLR